MQRRHAMLGAVLVAIIVGAGTLASVVHRRQVFTATAVGGIAPTPDLNRWPAEFRQVLAATADDVRAGHDTVTALGRLAELYIVNGFNAEGRQALAALSELEPMNPRWPYFQAELAIRENDFPNAETRLGTVTRLAPDYMPAWLRLGFVRLKREETEAARPCFERAVALAPDDVATRYEMISFEARHGARGNPLQQLFSLVGSHPDIKQLHELLAELQANAGDPAAAALERQRAKTAVHQLPLPDPWLDALATRCFDANRLMLLGAALEAQGRYEDAVPLLEHAVHVAPEDPALWNLFVDVLADRGDTTAVRALLLRAVTAAPDEPNLPARLARVLGADKQTDEAVAVVRQALARWPDNAMLYTTLATVLREGGRLDAAFDAIGEALRRDDSQPETHYQAGMCLLQDKQRDAAKAALRTALEIRPDFPDALFVLGGMAIEAEDIATAQPYVERLFALQPAAARARGLFAALRLLQGLAAARAGDSDGAEKLFRGGLEADSDFAPLHLEFARLDERRGRFAAAVEEYEQYLRLSPHEPTAYQQLGHALEAAGRTEDARQVYARGLTAAQEAGDARAAADFRRLLDL